MRTLHRSPIVVFLAAAIACAPADAPEQRASESSPAAATADNPRAEARPPRADAPKVVILGDSLTAGLGLNRTDSFPSLLQARLTREGYDYEVVNAGVSGDTSAGGLRRLDWALEGNVRVLVIELGANDGLRGLPVAGMKKNLSEIITRAKSRGIAVILAGMEAPPNYGPKYTDEFRQAYRDLAAEHDVPLIPFLLEGVAGLRAMNQGDGIHPNPEGARIVESTVWRALEPVLEAPAAQ
jgi:acyl-CoA thioesterase I